MFKGNFIELLKLLGNYHGPLMAHLDKIWSTKNKKNRLTFMSHESQNNILNILGNQVRSVIIKDLISANLFAIIIDTTTDISNIEQFSLIVRYVHEGNFKIKAKQIILSAFP